MPSPTIRNGSGRAYAPVGAPSNLLAVEGQVEFGGEFGGVEGTACEVAVADLEGGDFAAAVVDAEDQVLGIGIFLDIDFADFDAAILEKRFGTTAIWAPGGAVHDDGFDEIGSHLADIRLDAAKGARVGTHI